MARVLLDIILPLLLPTALYVLWAATWGRAAPAGHAGSWRTLPWTWLALAGALLVAAVLVTSAEFGGSGDGTYVPPHLEHGVIVPGHFVPNPPPQP